DNCLAVWCQDHREHYLDAFIEHEARGPFASQCAMCKAEDPTYRCLDCSTRGLFCKDCLMDSHCLNLLHCIQHWNNNRFEHTSFTLLGVRFPLGHGGKHYAVPRMAHSEFTVIHTNGIHSVLLEFCGCNLHYNHYQQLMDIAWFPSSTKDPRTCATYAVLQQFHTLNLQSKTMACDYYKTLTILTDATGLRNVPDKLKPFMIMVCEWHHLKMTKRASRGHDVAGISGTKKGELAVPCCACPQPGINLPPGWDKAPFTVSWIYQLFLSQDANFRLKNRLRSSEEKDPSLSLGWAYFVSTDEYLEHLAKYVDEDESGGLMGKGWSRNGLGSTVQRQAQVKWGPGLGMILLMILWASGTIIEWLNWDMIRAIPEWIGHRQAFTIFTDTLQENYATEVREWNRQVIEWEKQDLRSVNERTITQAEKDERAWTYNIAANRNLPHTVSTLNLQTGEGHRTVSWIWYNISQGELENDESLNEGIRLEWLKARARAERWKEEICLVKEEMRCVLEYSQWKAAWWKEQGRKRVGSSTVLAEGLLAYATEQANVEEARVRACELRWKDVHQRAQEVLADDSGTISFGTIEVALDTTEEEEKEM
ncbi:hypothetical protein H0H92_001819, partial [Tricholoma furcatifolium]